MLQYVGYFRISDSKIGYFIPLSTSFSLFSLHFRQKITKVADLPASNLLPGIFQKLDPDPIFLKFEIRIRIEYFRNLGYGSVIIKIMDPLHP